MKDDFGLIDADKLIPETEKPETEMDWIREMKAMKINFSELSRFGEYGQSVRIYIGYCHRLLNPLFRRYQHQKRNNRSAGQNSARARNAKSEKWKRKFRLFYIKQSTKNFSTSSIIKQFRLKHRRQSPPSPATLRRCVSHYPTQ